MGRIGLKPRLSNIVFSIGRTFGSPVFLPTDDCENIALRYSPDPSSALSRFLRLLRKQKSPHIPTPFPRQRPTIRRLCIQQFNKLTNHKFVYRKFLILLFLRLMLTRKMYEKHIFICEGKHVMTILQKLIPTHYAASPCWAERTKTAGD
jgi:hypothetical protein